MVLYGIIMYYMALYYNVIMKGGITYSWILIVCLILHQLSQDAVDQWMAWMAWTSTRSSRTTATPRQSFERWGPVKVTVDARMQENKRKTSSCGSH